MRRRIEGSVVVVVGASSGVGREVALLFAERGADLVVAARSPEPLRALAAELRQRGARVLTVPVDIGEVGAADRLAEQAVAELGRIDTWVNCAGVLVAGPFGTEPVEEVERLVRTNVLGQVWGARAALHQFRQQGSGVLIDVASVLGMVPNPIVPLYTMSKFAIRGLALSLHHYTSLMPGVRACVVCPGPIDTPLFDRAGNHTGRQLRPIPPAMAPERVAAAVVSCARRPRRQVVVGGVGKAIVAGQRISPRLTEWVVARAAATLLTRDQPARPDAGKVDETHRVGRGTGAHRRCVARQRVGRWVGRWMAPGG